MIARWTTIDPLAEDISNITPYNYGLNNPVLMIDADGREAGAIADLEQSKPKPKPKPIQLKEVKITATRIKKNDNSNNQSWYVRAWHWYEKATYRPIPPASHQTIDMSIMFMFGEGGELEGSEGEPNLGAKWDPVKEIISDNLRIQKQLNEHTLGGKDLGTNSYLKNTSDAQKVLDEAHDGSASILSVNASQNRIYVQDNNVTGYYNNNGQIVDTHTFLIKGGTSATVVPVHPNTTTFK